MDEIWLWSLLGSVVFHYRALLCQCSDYAHEIYDMYIYLMGTWCQVYVTILVYLPSLCTSSSVSGEWDFIHAQAHLSLLWSPKERVQKRLCWFICILIISTISTLSTHKSKSSFKTIWILGRKAYFWSMFLSSYLNRALRKFIHF